MESFNPPRLCLVDGAHFMSERLFCMPFRSTHYTAIFRLCTFAFYSPILQLVCGLRRGIMASDFISARNAALVQPESSTHTGTQPSVLLQGAPLAAPVATSIQPPAPSPPVPGKPWALP